MWKNFLHAANRSINIGAGNLIKSAQIKNFAMQDYKIMQVQFFQNPPSSIVRIMNGYKDSIYTCRMWDYYFSESLSKAISKQNRKFNA